MSSFETFRRVHYAFSFAWQVVRKRRNKARGLTIHVQPIMSNPLLPTQRRVDCLAVQRRPVVFPLHWDADGAGYAECLPIVLLWHNTYREDERIDGGWMWKLAVKTQICSFSLPPAAKSQYWKEKAAGRRLLARASEGGDRRKYANKEVEVSNRWMSFLVLQQASTEGWMSGKQNEKGAREEKAICIYISWQLWAAALFVFR